MKVTMQLLRAPRKAIKKYSLLCVFADNSEYYEQYSKSKRVLENYAREFKKCFPADIKQIFIFDNELGRTVKELKI